MEAEATADDAKPVAKWRRLVLSAGLKVIDTLSGLLSRLRSRVAGPPDEEDASGDDKRKSRPPADAVAAPGPALPKPRRLLYFLLFTMVLTAGMISGAVFSYRLLSKAINANAVMTDSLRDELAHMRKQQSLNLKEIANSQRTIRGYDQGIVGYLKELEDYRSQVEELRSQLSAARDGRSGPSSAATVKRPQPQKTGNCTMDSTNVTASLTNCVENFNRK